MKKRFFRKSILIAVTITVLISLIMPGHAFAWSGVVGNNTHGAIDEAAYSILSQDPAFQNAGFPSLQSIQDNDWVSPIDRTGPGPDVIGQSNASSHYYNPRLKAHQVNAGGGPETVKTEFLNLVNTLNSGSASNAAHAASWAAHFIADLNTPYHMQGTYREDIMRIYNAAGGPSATTVPLPDYVFGTLGLSTTFFDHPNDFKDEIEEFISGTAAHTGTEDWFDPWYWDGSLDAMLTSSHVVYEADTLIMPGSIFDWTNTSGGVHTYSSYWQNPSPGFDDPVGQQANRIIKFSQDIAGLTQSIVDAVDGSVTSTIYLGEAIKSVATVWRASFSGLSPSVTFTMPDRDESQKFKVQGTVTNTAGENVYDVQFKLTVTGGSISNGDTVPYIGYIEAGGQQTYTWEVEASQIGYCTAKLEVIGKYYDTPDLQYAVTQETAPGIIPVEVEPENEWWNNSMVFCLDNSGSMSGQPIADAMNAGVQAVTAVPSGPIEMALYFFGTNACDPPVRIVDFTVNKDTIKSAMMTASARGDTPLAAMITEAGRYIKSSGRGKQATIILLTDGQETCGGNPLEAARALNQNLKLNGFFSQIARAAGDTPIKLQIVGFNISYADTENMLREIAEAGNGNYYPATGTDELVEALTAAVHDATGPGFEFQYWWILIGVVVILLFIGLVRKRNKPAAVPVPQTAGIAKVVPNTIPRQNIGTNAVRPASFCTNCGNKISPNAAFCPGCGRPVSNVTMAGPVSCPQCGVTVAAGDAFCRKCGSPLGPGTSFPQTQAAQPVMQNRFCTSCGTPRINDRPFCSSCGNRFTS